MSFVSRLFNSTRLTLSLALGLPRVPSHRIMTHPQPQPNPGECFFSVPDFLKHYRIINNTWRETDMEPAPVTEPSNFGKLVVQALAAMTKNGAIDQRLLRIYLTMTPSYLVMDTSMNSECGIASWRTGFMRLVDVLVPLHKRGELELETINAASKACSECWSVSGSWRGLEECKDTIREVAGKLKTLLDANGRTFQGQRIYTP